MREAGLPRMLIHWKDKAKRFRRTNQGMVASCSLREARVRGCFVSARGGRACEATGAAGSNGDKKGARGCAVGAHSLRQP